MEASFLDFLKTVLMFSYEQLVAIVWLVFNENFWFWFYSSYDLHRASKPDI